MAQSGLYAIKIASEPRRRGVDAFGYHGSYLRATERYIPRDLEGLAKPGLTERQTQLREFWAASEAAIKAGMRTLSNEEINEEVADLRGANRGAL